MTNWLVTKNFIRRILLFLVVLPAWAFAQSSGGLIIFGDSVSDSGNFFHQTGDVVKAPFEPIPDAPYAIGGHHFSNNATWVEQLAETLDLVPSAHPAVVRPGRFTNYAFGRARARAGAPVFPMFDLGSQVGLFLTDFGGTAPSDALYVVFIGSNDARDAANEAAGGGNPVPIIAASVTAISNNIVALFFSGAKTFVVLNVPNLGLLPAVPDPFRPGATAITVGYNGALSGALDAVESIIGPLGGQIIRVDTFALFNDVVADGGMAAGLSNVTDACLTFFVQGGAICEDPDAFLFWDGAHPTRAGHAILAAEVAGVLPAP